jgi:hypothetical protein
VNFFKEERFFLHYCLSSFILRMPAKAGRSKNDYHPSKIQRERKPGKTEDQEARRADLPVLGILRK